MWEVPNSVSCKEEMLNESYLEVWKDRQDILRNWDVDEIGIDLRTMQKATERYFSSGLGDNLQVWHLWIRGRKSLHMSDVNHLKSHHGWTPWEAVELIWRSLSKSQLLWLPPQIPYHEGETRQVWCPKGDYSSMPRFNLLLPRGNGSLVLLDLLWLFKRRWKFENLYKSPNV